MNRQILRIQYVTLQTRVQIQLRTNHQDKYHDKYKIRPELLK